MPGIRLKHVERFRDRLGKVRYYYRRGHGPRIPLEGEPGTAEFNADYARAATQADRKEKPGPAPGSIAELCAAYLASPNFTKLKPVSQYSSRRIIEAFAHEHGHAPLATFSREHVDIIVGRKSATPAAANVLLKKIRILVRFGLGRRMLTVDPTLGVARYKSGEFHSWTEAQIAQFEKHWKVGTLQRTAFDLHLYTGQRRSDVCVMRWDDITRDVIAVHQSKTGEKLKIPLHAALRKSLKATPRTGETILAVPGGAVRSHKGYGGYMADAIDQAGLPAQCVLHGLRKAAARRLAEAGCSANEIASITGHRTLEEVSRYTRAAEQGRLAEAAMDRLKISLGKRRKAK